MAKMASEEELAELEKLSASFVPEQKGDLVGSRVSTQLLTEEYAKADPVYAGKTQNLPLLYPEYRTIRGDGNCGFRAIAFGFFESLVRLDDASKIRAEASRLQSLNHMLDATGQEVYMYEDWVEETLKLLEETASTPRKDIPKLLLDAFNDLEIANAITQHFRMITSAQLKLNPDDYAPFVPDLDVEGYCKNHVDPFYEEIEHISVKALVDSIINPAGIAVGYLYLDRSMGTEATPYSFPLYDEKGNEKLNVPTISLLYRPGHYDLLYTEADLEQAEANLQYDDPAKIEDDAGAIVLMCPDLPNVILLEDIDFEGLPGFDPEAHFNLKLPNPDLDGMVQAQPSGAECDDQTLPVTTTQDLPVSDLIDELEEINATPPAQSRARRAQRKRSSKTSSSPLKQQNFVPAELPTKSQLVIKEEEVSETADPPPMPAHEEQTAKGNLNWNPKTIHQDEYNRSTLPASSLKSPSTAPPKKHSPVARAPAYYKAKGGTFAPKQYDGESGDYF